MASISIPAKIARRVSHFVSNEASDLMTQHVLKQCHLTSTSSIPTYTTKNELKQLFQLAASCPANAFALEIGSYLGASTCYIAAGLSLNTGHLYCVDTWQNETMPEGERDTFVEFQKNIEGVRHLVTPLRKHSVELIEQDLSLPLSLVFIDGDHSYQAVKADFERITPWLASDGVIAFHDCLFFSGVSRLIGEALASGQWMIGGHIHNLLWITPGRFNE